MSWQDIAASLGCPEAEIRPVGGGCINDCVRVGRDLFVKRNAADRRAMFEAEAEALREIARTATIRVPEVVALGADGSDAWLALEFLPLRRADARAEEKTGERLAAMHRVTAAVHGWRRDNFIGATPQSNTPDADWARFFAERRIAPHLALARGRFRRGDELLEKIPQLLGDHRPAPSLLHGDLWGGNAAADADGDPVVFDPAVYYGDRETDIAFTELFGGFGEAFYRSYAEHFPLPEGYAARRPLYNLYHMLNHWNLFGGGYAAQAEAAIELCLR